MNNDMQILDCTFRDGGYYTNWNFTNELLDEYLKTVSKLPISIVELGYLSDNNDFNGPFYHLNKNFLKNCKSKLNKKQKIFAMINTKEVKNSKQLIKLIGSNYKYIDGVRFAISPYDVKKFLPIIKIASKKFKKLSFNVNLMYLNKWYKDLFFAKKIIKTLSDQVDTIAIVDSYGSLQPDEISRFVKKIKNKNVKLGCHFHNNCGLALANTLSAIDAGCEVADTTFRGMGRGAGNAETEMLIALKTPIKPKISSFDINNLIDKFEKMKSKMKWGGSYAYAFAAKAGFSQNQMMDLIQKRRLDPGMAVNAISSNNQNIKKIKFKNIKNLKKLKFSNSHTPILIGGAPSLKDYGLQLFNKINFNTPIILSGSNALFNFLSLNAKIKNPIILILSGSEINKIVNINKKNFLKNLKIYAIIIEKDFLPNKINFQPKNRIVISESIAINPLLLTGLALLKYGIKKMHLAFFDGQFDDEKGRVIMQETEESVKKLMKSGLDIKTLTKSFLQVKQINPWLND
tara:strand:- start:3034 stop:4578 length:1545 start_codon:yes stop_codon:yes gene_type:complete